MSDDQGHDVDAPSSDGASLGNEGQQQAKRLGTRLGRTRDQAVPLIGLRAATDVVRVVHDKFGGHCENVQLAAALGHQDHRSGTFTAKVGAARRFGLLETSRGTISTTDLGRAILGDESSPAVRSAKVAAFFSVPLYEAVYEEFRGTVLPSPEGLEAKLVALGAPTGTVRLVRLAFMRSAEEAGFFNVSPGRLVKPSVAPRESRDDGAERQVSHASPESVAAPSASDVAGTGTRSNIKTLALSGGEELTLSLPADLFRMDKDDRDFALRLVDLMTAYEQGDKNAGKVAGRGTYDGASADRQEQPNLGRP